MTYDNMVDLINATHQVQCTQRQIPYVRLQRRYLYQLVSESEAEIQRRVQVVLNNTPVDMADTKTYADENSVEYVDEGGIYYVSGNFTYNYVLPSDYGNMIKLVINDTEVEYVSPAEFVSLVAVTENFAGFLYYTIVAHEGQTLLRIGPTGPTGVDTIIPIYYKTILPYRERDINNATLIILPNDYHTAIQFGVLRNLFPDYNEQFERTVRSLREYRNSQGVEQTSSSLGGL